MKKNILFTDIVGYSKLTGDDQSLALELLNEHDKIIEPIIFRYQGKIVKRIGDAIVAIFDDTKHMIQASIEVQQSLKNRNNRNIKSRKLVLRIGLHYGQILIKNDEIYGKGYDLASEIEPICEYGGIAISEAVYSQSHEDNELIVKGINNHFFIHPIAEFKFKSHSAPILVYKLYLNLLDWYDELYSDAPNYLLDQHVSTDKYNLSNINNYDLKKIDNHLALAESFVKKHNLSYAVYHYKIFLDYSKQSNSEIELKILKIFAECGLIRLVNKAFKNNKLHNNTLSLLIQGINLFNQKKWDDAISKFENFTSSNNSIFIMDGLYYLIILFFNQKSYNSIIELIDSKKHYIEKSNFHSLLIAIIQEIILHESKIENKDYSNNIINLFAQLETELRTIKDLNQQKYLLFLYYILIVFHEGSTTIENAINIQNKGIKIIKDCELAISGFLLKQLFLKNPILHKMIMEPLELEFVNEEGLDEYDLDDILTNQTDITKFCTSCGSKNNIKFQFCIKCGEKLIN